MACAARDGEITVIFLTYQAKVTPTALNARLESILKQLAVNLRDGNVSRVVMAKAILPFRAILKPAKANHLFSATSLIADITTRVAVWWII
jgi:hypothetical protein